ncbi:MAG: DUF1587 domain-containing protein, partial [Verrucomicrobiota bacterium]
MQITNIQQVITFGLATSLLAAAPLGAAPLKRLEPFLVQHCFDCHDEDVSKGDLDLASMSLNPADPKNAHVWETVVERVLGGEMPPKKKPRPAKDETRDFLAFLTPILLKADEARRAEEGRVKVRRLTRREYEHSIHDLIGVDLPLQDMLPEDSVTHGYETVATGQQLSHFHLARYLEAADRALDHAFTRATKGDTRYKRFFKPSELKHQGSGNNRSPEMRDGRNITWKMGPQFYGRMYMTEVKESG